MKPGSILTVEIEKPIAGGRMLARHGGQIVFVAGAIPGERVSARVSRVAKGVLYADAEEILTSSSDRRPGISDLRCGGSVLSHIAPARQLRLKGEVIEDAFRRVAKIPLGSVPVVVGSPEQGYRMRARLHVRGQRAGFLREGTHDLCDAECTGQLLAATSGWVRLATETLARKNLHDLQSIEIAENVPASERACHLELAGGARIESYAELASGLTGLSAQRTGDADAVQLSGQSVVTDRLPVVRHGKSATVTLSRDVRAFFQGNRYLLEALTTCVAELVPEGPVVDLYAGVGLFGLSLAALGYDRVTLVEGDRVSGTDLRDNAVPFGSGIVVQRVAVEQFLRSDRTAASSSTFIVDPPRTGLSADALRGIIGRAPAAVVYVSCDVATLARDSRGLIDAGYRLESLKGFDLFPNTAHIETVASFVRAPEART
ncbi:MAG: TRAM domain-containing protein [Vicinamibacterales bacterium]